MSGPIEVSRSLKKWDNLIKASLFNKRNPKNAMMQKMKKAQKNVINTYQKEQLEYTQGQINEIRNSLEDRQSQILC